MNTTTTKQNDNASAAAAGQAAHTPTPWATEGSFVIHPASGMTVADCQLHRDTPEEKGEDNANAAFIVRACNSHAALVEALKAIREEATAYPEGGEDCFKYSLSLIAEKARALLATLEATP